MFAIAWIIDLLNRISSIFHELYLDCYYALWPLNTIAHWFYYLSTLFNDLAWDFYHFSEWVQVVDERIRYLITFADIEAYFAEFIRIATNAWNWVSNAFWNVWDIVDDWWSVTSWTVRSWIDIALSQTRFWLDYLEARVNELTSSWNTFVTVTLPSLPNWPDIDALIKSWFISFSPFWEGWQDWRDDVANFFTDPEDWLYKAVDRIVERFW